MIDGKRVLALIPAKANSRRVPGKNIRNLNGKPLIYWTIRSAQESNYIDNVVVSTENMDIADIARHYGAEVPFLRPEELSKDETSGMDPVLHALDQLDGFDFIVELQVTSPFRATKDIDGCIAICIKSGAKACVSVSSLSAHPDWIYRKEDNGSLSPLLSSDNGVINDSIVRLNGAVYVAEVEWLIKYKTFLTGQTVSYEMPVERSLDIDTPYDWYIAEKLASDILTNE